MFYTRFIYFIYSPYNMPYIAELCEPLQIYKPHIPINAVCRVWGPKPKPCAQIMQYLCLIFMISRSLSPDACDIHRFPIMSYEILGIFFRAINLLVFIRFHARSLILFSRLFGMYYEMHFKYTGKFTKYMYPCNACVFSVILTTTCMYMYNMYFLCIVCTV